MTSQASKVHTSEKSRFTQSGARNRIYQRKKSLKESRLDSTDKRFEFTDLDSTIPSPGPDSKLRDISVIGGQENVKNMLKVVKPMSPNPSDSSALLASYLKTTCTSPDNSSVENNCNSKEFEHILTNLDPVSIRAENMHLKDLLVSQLDLIQQQSETILSRDKQLKDLRMENEHLRQRLERMERRVRGEADGGSPVASSINQADNSVSKEPGSRKRQLVQGEDSHTPAKRFKRDSVTSNSSLKKDIKVEVNEYTRFDELTDEIFEESDYRFRIGEDIKEREGGAVSASAAEGETCSQGCAGDPADPEKGAVSEFDKEASEKKGKQRKNPRKSVPTVVSNGVYEPLLTPYHYFIGCKNDIVNKDDKLNEVAALQRGVEVPKFREDKEYDKKMTKIKSSHKKNPYSNKNSDSLENLDDSVFIKRHEKPEASEKRLKKWDIQRLREKSYCEKLRARYNLAGRNKKPEIDSLLPTPEGAEKILILRDGKVPVSAFGEAVPALQPSYFSLPWLDHKQSKNETVQKKLRQ